MRIRQDGIKIMSPDGREFFCCDMCLYELQEGLVEYELIAGTDAHTYCDICPMDWEQIDDIFGGLR